MSDQPTPPGGTAQPPVADPYGAPPAAPSAAPGTSSAPAPGSPSPGSSSATAAPAPVMERPHPLTAVVKGWMALVGLALVWGRDTLQEVTRHRDSGPAGEQVTWLGIDLAIWVFGGAVLAYLVITSLVGWLQWRTTLFVVDDHELRIEHHLVRHTSDRVPFTKVQSVDVVQPLAARLLGLAQLRIDVGAGRPRTIEYLGRERAYRMRDYLVARAHGHDVTVAEAAVAAVGGALRDVAGHERVLLAVPPARLVLAAVLSSGFVTTLLAGAAVVAGLWWWGRGPAVAVLVPLATGLVGIIRSAVVKQWGFRLVEAGGALKVTRGMTALVSQTIPVGRIQGVVVSQHLLWRPFGLYRVQVDVLGYGHGEDADEQASDVLLPAGTRDEVATALRAVWPSFDLDAVPLHRPPRSARWLDPLQYGFLAWGRTDDVVLARCGLTERRTTVVHHARVQSAHLDQGPLQRRLGLASVQFDTTTPLGSAVAVHLDEQVARGLFDDEMALARAARRREDQQRAATPATSTAGQAAPAVAVEGPVSDGGAGVPR